MIMETINILSMIWHSVRKINRKHIKNESESRSPEVDSIYKIKVYILNSIFSSIPLRCLLFYFIFFCFADGDVCFIFFSYNFFFSSLFLTIFILSQSGFPLTLGHSWERHSGRCGPRRESLVAPAQSSRYDFRVRSTSIPYVVRFTTIKQNNYMNERIRNNIMYIFIYSFIWL